VREEFASVGIVLNDENQIRLLGGSARHASSRSKSDTQEESKLSGYFAV